MTLINRACIMHIHIIFPLRHFTVHVCCNNTVGVLCGELPLMCSWNRLLLITILKFLQARYGCGFDILLAGICIFVILFVWILDLLLLWTVKCCNAKERAN